MKQIRTPLTGTPLPMPLTQDPRAPGPLHPADELAQVRAALRWLHAREDKLRRHFTSLAAAANPNRQDAGALTGSAHTVTVTPHRKRVFDRSLLPQAILANPRFYRDETHTHVTTHPTPVALQPLLPGLPPDAEAELSDFDLIEPINA